MTVTGKLRLVDEERSMYRQSDLFSHNHESRTEKSHVNGPQLAVDSQTSITCVNEQLSV